MPTRIPNLGIQLEVSFIQFITNPETNPFYSKNIGNITKLYPNTSSILIFWERFGPETHSNCPGARLKRGAMSNGKSAKYSELVIYINKERGVWNKVHVNAMYLLYAYIYIGINGINMNPNVTTFSHTYCKYACIIHVSCTIMLYQCFCANTARPHCHTCLTQTASLRRHRRSTDSHSREPDVDLLVAGWKLAQGVLSHRLSDWKIKERWTSMWTKRHGNNQHNVSCSDEVLDLLVKT